MPPPDKIGYYSDPKTRGYLADPEAIAKERFELAQKYGYTLPNLENDPMVTTSVRAKLNFCILLITTSFLSILSFQKHILLARKDPNQVFYGLEPGWVINLRDKEILVPEDEELVKYYNQA